MAPKRKPSAKRILRPSRAPPSSPPSTSTATITTSAGAGTGTGAGTVVSGVKRSTKTTRRTISIKPESIAIELGPKPSPILFSPPPGPVSKSRGTQTFRRVRMTTRGTQTTPLPPSPPPSKTLLSPYEHNRLLKLRLLEIKPRRHNMGGNQTSATLHRQSAQILKLRADLKRRRAGIRVGKEARVLWRTVVLGVMMTAVVVGGVVWLIKAEIDFWAKMKEMRNGRMPWDGGWGVCEVIRGSGAGAGRICRVKPGGGGGKR